MCVLAFRYGLLPSSRTMVATACSRVYVPWGEKVVELTPFISPILQATSTPSSAQSDTWSQSVKERSPAWKWWKE